MESLGVNVVSLDKFEGAHNVYEYGVMSRY